MRVRDGSMEGTTIRLSDGEIDGALDGSDDGVNEGCTEGATVVSYGSMLGSAEA